MCRPSAKSGGGGLIHSVAVGAELARGMSATMAFPNGFKNQVVSHSRSATDVRTTAVKYAIYRVTSEISHVQLTLPSMKCNVTASHGCCLPVDLGEDLRLVKMDGES
jgi:hypothetical protein